MLQLRLKGARSRALSSTTDNQSSSQVHCQRTKTSVNMPSKFRRVVETIVDITCRWADKIWFCYFASLDRFLRDPRLRIGPREVPDPMKGSRLTFLAQSCLLIAAALFASSSSFGMDKQSPADEDRLTFIDQLVSAMTGASIRNYVGGFHRIPNRPTTASWWILIQIALFNSLLQLVLREMYKIRIKALEQRREDLLRMFAEFETRSPNTWPLPMTPQFYAHLVEFDRHKMQVVEHGGYMMLALLITGAAHVGVVLQSLFHWSAVASRIATFAIASKAFPSSIRFQVLSASSGAPTIALLLLAHWITIVDYALRIPILVRFQWLYCTTHFAPNQSPAEA